MGRTVAGLIEELSALGAETDGYEVVFDSQGYEGQVSVEGIERTDDERVVTLKGQHG